METVALFIGLGVNTLGLAIVLFKMVWGGAASHHIQFSMLEKACSESISAVRNDLLARLETQSTNIGNVTANINDRIHRVELAAMETRAVAAETFMRRDSYHKATDEFKRDVRTSHDDLKEQMQASFKELKEQIDSVSQSIEAGRRHRASPA